MPKSTKENLFSTVRNQSYRKFDEMPKSTKQFFSLFGQWGGGGGPNAHLNQSCRKFDEMPKKISFANGEVVQCGGMG